MAIGENIKRIRKEKGYTQKQLAEKCEMYESQIRKYELNKANPKVDTLKKIAKALDCEVSDIDEHIYIVPPYKPSPELLEKFKLEADVREILKKYEEGITLTSEEWEKIFDYNEKMDFEIAQRKNAIKNAPKAFITKNGKKSAADKPVKFTTASRSHAQTEAYDLFHSLLSKDWIINQEQETTAIQLREMLGAYNRLNDSGRKEAIKRIEELTEIPRYTQKEKNQPDKEE